MYTLPVQGWYVCPQAVSYMHFDNDTALMGFKRSSLDLNKMITTCGCQYNSCKDVGNFSTLLLLHMNTSLIPKPRFPRIAEIVFRLPHTLRLTHLVQKNINYNNNKRPHRFGKLILWALSPRDVWRHFKPNLLKDDWVQLVVYSPLTASDLP